MARERVMKKINHTIMVSLALLLTPVYAVEEPESPKKQTVAENYLTAVEAHDLKLQQGEKLLFVDIRTQPELVFVGSANDMDINIPFLSLDFGQWDKQSASFKKIPNSQFISAFDRVIGLKSLNKNSPIVLLCRSGKRSAAAANLLTSAGYKKVYTVIDGFEDDKAKKGNEKGRRVINGWKNAGLPWTYKLQQSHLGLSN
jgi:rhodanese-related sulfurtransferase